MLQQTQTSRVIEKYAAFIKAFPTIKKLADVPLKDILSVWQGMGYNRRALYLKRLAGIVVHDYHGTLPKTETDLKKLPGIGAGTAGAICAFAYNQPVSFIETNIRSVFIYFFFKDKTDVRDSEIFPLIQESLDEKNPREWYYALMDYGAMLKKKQTNPSRKSAHYTRQSSFKGSNRQLRGKILQLLSQENPVLKDTLLTIVEFNEFQILKALENLKKEGFIIERNGKIFLV